MRIFVAGATGAIGRQLVPMLVARGHEVTGMTRSPAKRDLVREMGARPVIADALDPEAVAQAVAAAEPEVVVHELTAIDAGRFGRDFDKAFAPTNRLRVEGTDHLLAAAKATGARRFVAQSFSPWLYARVGGPVKTEEDPLDDAPPKAVRETFAAIRHVEETVTAADGIEGIVLRYGGFYGPGTSIALQPDGEQVTMIRKGRLPIIGDGAGVWSFVHIADAASATAAAVERGDPGAYNVVDDEPARVSEFLPELARAVGARPPRRVPRWLGRLLGGEATVVMMTEFRGASNAKAKRELGWEPRYPSWRLGFRQGLSDPGRATVGNAA
ncbi:MAG TPA: NAD(P)-dependent oxidoreductase [Solirubrobacteraceae bacterium]|nr:NAD(P)-dependent oxidoreductase [Solirubrobacteraceae bacterium]